jgi:hypothetical protein
VPVIVPRRLHAPEANRAILAQPPLAEVGEILAENRKCLECHNREILGRALADLRREARQAVLTAAREYLSQAGEPVPSFGSTSFVIAGHQPELFHPGVWIKNFALFGLAQQHQITPLNLVVDNDTAKTAAIRVPSSALWNKSQEPGDKEALSAPPQLSTVPFDRWVKEAPYEERRVIDEDLFADFSDRVGAALGDWGFTPLLPEYWAEVRRQANRTALLGERLVSARRAIERSWGCHNLEIPVSVVCRTEPFAWFAGHLLVNLAKFHAIHNDCLNEYRRVYGLRSKAHPVPDLLKQDAWLEVPLWAWRSERPERGRLMARMGNNVIELRVGGESWPTLKLTSGAELVAQWMDLERRGFKIRSRALTNTMYARLVLCDLFVHGVGGAKYDELTDEIIRRFYGMEPPRYLTLSGTLRLPLPTFPASNDDCDRLAWLVRDYQWNPQRHLENGNPRDPETVPLAAQKHAWTARVPQSRSERRERFLALRQLTSQLRSHLAGRESQLRNDWLRCGLEVQVNALLQRRDYPFCLFPAEAIRPFCTQFLHRPRDPA